MKKQELARQKKILNLAIGPKGGPHTKKIWPTELGHPVPGRYKYGDLALHVGGSHTRQ
jgi:hypothetical protein